MTVEVSDPADPRLADYRNVPDPELLRDRGLFIAEGRLVVRRLLTGSRFTARSVLVTRVAHDSLRDVLLSASLPVYLVPQSVITEIAGFNIHRGCLAVGERRPDDSWRHAAMAASTIVVLERVANADNIGAVFRSAAAFGGEPVLLDPTSTDPLYRKAIRTSMGAALAVPFARLAPWPAALRELAATGVALVGMTTSARAGTLSEIAGQVAGRRVALLLGHEGEGLSADALACCDYQARIPMAAGVDSLNVAMAAAIGLYELKRHPV